MSVGGRCWSGPTTTTAADLEQQLVAGLRREKQVIAQAEIDRLQLVVEWAQLHQTPLDHNPEDVGFRSRYLALAGPGAPLVEEFAVTDLAASLGMSDHAGRELLAQALELRYRLPRLWQPVRAGKVATWKATGIAVQTRALTPAGADFVDEQLAHAVAGGESGRHRPAHGRGGQPVRPRHRSRRGKKEG